MSWQPWSSGALPGLTGLQSVVNPAPAVLPAGSQYTPEQWAQMQHQNWQQWAQWQQQYQQWHQQYGAEYQKSMSALSQQPTTRSTFQPPVPNVSVPPPLPKEAKPPLPPEEPPKEPVPQTPTKNFNTQQNFTSAPPPSFNTAAPPPTQPRSQAKSPFKNAPSSHNQPPPNIRQNKGGNYNSYNQNRQTGQNQYNDNSRNIPNKQEYVGEKRPMSQPSFRDSKKTKIDDTPNVPSRSPAPNSNEDLSETEKKFIKQFTEWEAQFNKWKDQNMNHPDKEQYKEYEKKWEAWRTQLLERREQMRRKRLGIAEKPTMDTRVPPMKQSPFNTSMPPPVIKEAGNTSKIPSLMGKDIPSLMGKDIPSLMGKDISSLMGKDIPSLMGTDIPPPLMGKDISSIMGKDILPLMGKDILPLMGKDIPPLMGKEIPPLMGKDILPPMDETSLPPSASSVKDARDADLPQELLHEEFDEAANDDTSFLKMSKSNDGIPGLDLVRDNQEQESSGEKRDDVIDLDEDKARIAKRNQEEMNKGADFEAISKGINNILGDQKLLNMLSMVSQNQNNPMLSGSIDTTLKPPTNTDPQGNIQTFNEGSNQGANPLPNPDQQDYCNQNTDDNYDEHSRGSFGGRGGGDFEWRDSYKAGGWNDYGNDNFGKRGFGRGPDNFRGGPDNMRGGPENMRGGPDNSRGGPDNFRGGPDNFRGGPDNFRGGPDSFRTGGDNFRAGGDNFRAGVDSLKNAPDNFNRGGPDNFRGGPGNFKSGPDGFQGGPDNSRGGLDNSRGGQDNSRLISNNFRGGRDNFRGGADNFRGGPDNFRGGPDNFRGGPDNFRGGPDNFRGGPDNFRGGPDNFRGGPDNFRGGPDNFRGGPDTLKNANTENFNRGGADNFRGAPDSFRGGADNLESGPDNLRGGSDNFRSGADNFRGEKGANTFRGPDNFGNSGNQRAPEQFRNSNVWGGGFNDKEGRPSSFEPPASENFRGRFEPPRGQQKDNFSNFDNEHRRGDDFSGGNKPNFPNKDFGNNRNSDQFRQGDNLRGKNDSFSDQGNFRQNDRRGFERNSFGGSATNQPGPNAFRGLPDLQKPPPGNFGRGGPNDFNKGSNFQGGGNNFAGGAREALDDFKNAPDRMRDWNRGDFDRRQSFEEPGLQRKGFGNFIPSDDVPEQPENMEISMDVDEGQEKEPPMWQPTNIIEYDHKSSKTDEQEVSLEPLRTFDYRHKPVNRIPFPQRPQWLANLLKKYPEFDFVIARAYDQPNRYSDRYDRYAEGSRYENRWSNREQPAGPRKSLDEPSRPQKRYDDYGPSISRRPVGGASYPKKDYDRKIEDIEMRETETPRGRYEGHKGKSMPMDVRETEDNVTSKEDSEKFLQIPHKPRSSITLIQDILNPPGRYNRPARIVIILRGPPGSGKTFLAKLIKDKEVENGGSAPRILSLDDYFMVEQEKEVDVDGKRTKVKEMVYEYEDCMENMYRASLFKAFKKTITDGYFPFIIVDNVNEKVKYFGEMWSFAKQNGFQVYICQMEFDLNTCTKRNIHNRSEGEIQKLITNWEPTPAHHPILDATSLIQAGSIPEVEMEEINSPPSEDFDSQDIEDRMCRSKWDNFDCSIDNLAKLDGTSKPLRASKTMEDYLHCDDDQWVSRESKKPGQKRVRWADLEERKKQEKMRAIGFVVGQTNWDRMMDPTMGSSALTQTKYIERVNNPRFYND